MLTPTLDPIRNSVDGGKGLFPSADNIWCAMPAHIKFAYILAAFFVLLLCLIVASDWPAIKDWWKKWKAKKF